MMMMKKKIAAGSSRTISNTAEANDVVVIVEVTEDLILEIFSHLPPTSLLRFKSVSKTWYSLISNPDFLRRNTANQFDRRRWQRCINDLPPPSILLKRYEFAGDSRILTFPPTPPNDYDQPPYYSYFHPKVSPLLLQKLIDYRPEHGYVQHQVHSDDEKEKFWVVDSCNGLLLYRYSIKYVIPPPSRKYNLYVCNPITHDYIKLPTFEQEEREQGFTICNYSSPNIVFDPSLSLTYKVVIWLTCTTTTIDHKTTISSSYWKKEEHYRLYVYSSVTRSWKLSISTNQIPVRLRYNLQRSVLCNGVLYCISNCPTFHTNGSLCYDVEKDVISILNFPKMPLECTHRALLYFGECGGRLRLIETYYKHQHLKLQVKFGEKIYVFPSIFDVMELDNNDDLWMVKYRVNFGDDQVGYYGNLVGKETHSLFDVHILDIYKTKTKNAGEQEVDQGEEEVLLLRIGDICIIPFNLSSNTFGKELPNGEKKSVGGGRYMGFTEVLRYNTITLFPPSSA